MRTAALIVCLVAAPAFASDGRAAVDALRACLAEAKAAGATTFDDAIATCADAADAAADAHYAALGRRGHDRDETDKMHATWLEANRADLEAGF